MTIVTVTGHLGSMGTIASRAASALGYTLADRELLLHAAEALHLTEADVAALDERTAGQGGRLARFLQDYLGHAPMYDLGEAGFGTFVASTYAEMAEVAEMRPRDERYIEMLTGLVRGLAERGNAVIVGRGGQATLANRLGTVHVRVVCDQDERVRRVAARDAMTLAAARARVEDSDRQREAWHQKYFGINYQSPYLYHIVLNSNRLTDEAAAQFIVKLARGAEADGALPATGTSAAPAPARQDWGWVELIAPATGEVHARAHLLATDVAADGAWRGQLESIRRTAALSALAPGRYFVRFARSGTDHTAELTLNEEGAQLHSDDAGVPEIFRERSEGE